ncbi:MAG TPA: PPC domain-containing protein [Gemmatimonadaceae bacterium]
MVATAVVAVSAACGSDATRPATTQPPPAQEISVDTGTAFAGRVSPSDSARYEFPTVLGQPFVVMLEVDTGSVALSIHHGGNAAPDQTIQAHTDPGERPARLTSTPITPPLPQLYHFVVTGQGSFHVRVFVGWTFPEHVSYVLPVGDTVSGETIDNGPPDDTDDFLLFGEPGEEFNIFFQAQTGSPSRALFLDIPDVVGYDVAVLANGADTALTERATGRFRMPASGIVRPRVVGSPDSTGRRTGGAYRLFVYPVHRPPEAGSASFTAGDSVLSERIDFPSDVDEFTLSVPASGTADFRVGCEPAGSLDFTILTSSDAPVAQMYVCGPPTSDQGATGRFLLSAGTYTIRVQAPDCCGLRHTPGFAGAYQMYLYMLHDAPERIAPTVAVGDTITGETLDPVGDVDVFTFNGRRGDDLIFSLEGLDSRWAQNLKLFVPYPHDPRPLAVAYSAPTGTPSMGSGHIVLPDSATYSIQIGPENNGVAISESGPYRAVVRRMSRATEHHDASIAVGDSVVGERLDGPDDLDEFTLTGAPNQEVAIYGSVDPSAEGLYLEAVDPVSRDLISSATTGTAADPTAFFTRPFHLSASGVAAVRFFKDLQTTLQPDGAYSFVVRPIDRAPESVSPSIAIGDTITGESIDPVGDIDEFTFAGTAGDSLIAYFALTPQASQLPLSLEVVVPGSGQVIALTTPPSASNLGAYHTFPFMLPATGSYLVRVYDHDGLGGYGSYQFTVQHAP